MPRTRQNMRRSGAAASLRHIYREGPGVPLSQAGIEEYLSACRAEGRTGGTLQVYRRGLQRLHADLPADKIIRQGTLEHWREELLCRGYAPNTVNGFLSVSNAYLDFVGHREYQLTEQLKPEAELQPELTRAEYLRLLQTARALDRERVYLLVKLFATTGIPVQELSKVTAEAVREGRINELVGRTERTVRIPDCLQRELLRYAQRNGYISGPLFLTKEGTPMSRTYVSTLIRQLCADARIPDGKGNPRCLKRLYQSTYAAIESNVALLVEQAMDRQLEMEQMAVGWEE